MPKVITKDNRNIGRISLSVTERQVKCLAKSEGKTLVNKQQYIKYLQTILPVLIEDKIKSNLIDND